MKNMKMWCHLGVIRAGEKMSPLEQLTLVDESVRAGGGLKIAIFDHAGSKKC